MSAFYYRRQLRHAAMAVRVGALVLLAFLSAPAGLVSGPGGAAHAQQQPAGKVYRIGFLSQGQPPQAFLEAVQQGLRERGYAEGRTSSGNSGRPTAAWTSFRNSPRIWCD